jgi:hypothetical protein
MKRKNHARSGQERKNEFFLLLRSCRDVRQPPVRPGLRQSDTPRRAAGVAFGDGLAGALEERMRRQHVSCIARRIPGMSLNPPEFVFIHQVMHVPEPAINVYSLAGEL